MKDFSASVSSSTIWNQYHCYHTQELISLLSHPRANIIAITPKDIDERLRISKQSHFLVPLKWNQMQIEVSIFNHTFLLFRTLLSHPRARPKPKFIIKSRLKTNMKASWNFHLWHNAKFWNPLLIFLKNLKLLNYKFYESPNPTPATLNSKFELITFSHFSERQLIQMLKLQS